MKFNDLSGAPYCFTQAGRGTAPLRNNYGLHVGDDPTLVHERRRLLSEELGRPVVWMDQVHSAEVRYLEPAMATSLQQVSEREGEWGPIVSDGIIVDSRGWDCPPAVAVMVADCLPILLSGLSGQVVAAVHAGRRGLLGGIIDSAIQEMRNLGCQSSGITAAIGPAACGQCYEVPTAMAQDAWDRIPAAASTTRWGTPAIDLRAAASAELERFGVKTIVHESECTIENTDCHSHRRDPLSGRQIGVIASVKL